jgi:hypothetical protein
MAAPHFKVKALYAYSSEHDDDLKFPDAQIITVTGEEDADWYIGEYEDTAGELQSGLFPKNFVERYEPAPPPRPTRTRPKPAEPPVLDAPKEVPLPQIPAASKPKPEEPEFTKPTPAVKPEDPPASIPSPKPVQRTFSATSESLPAPKPAQAVPAKGPPPPVADKSSSFKERLAAFNRGGDAPVTPFKPGGSGGANFIKKPFIAPPPSLNSFVPTPREPPPQKIYRREEDPEIAQRRADDDAAAEKAGLVADGEGEEEVAPKISLKERIALLQKTQMEQAARRVDTTQKEKPKRPPKKRMESHNVDDAAPRDSIDDSSERPVRGSSDVPRERPSKGPKSPESAPKEKEMFSDANDADQSAAGETTEDAERDSSTEEEVEIKRHEEAPDTQPEVGDEEDETEEDAEEDDVDPEVARQEALRERMAKLSGGMGMGGMFGAPGGMPMPGMAGGIKKKRPLPERKQTDDAESSPVPPPQRIPIMPMPGFGRTMSHDSETTVSKEEEDDHPVTATRAPAAVPDVEDVTPASPPRAPAARPQGKQSLSTEQLGRGRGLQKRACVGVFDSPPPSLMSNVDEPACSLSSATSYHQRDGAKTPLTILPHSQNTPAESYKCSHQTVVRKPLSQFQSPQIRFIRSKTHPSKSMFLSEDAALSWVLGRLRGPALILSGIAKLTCFRTSIATCTY